MSITGLNPDIDRLYGNNTFHHHHRNDSTELDVFEAARYFSGDPATDNNKLSLAGARRRNSLDLPAARNHHHHYYTAADQNQNQNKKQAPVVVVVKDKRHKQPSSPGGRLATFLNSLFTQSSKNKKPKSAAAASPDDDDFPGGGARRRRRSSISHFSFGNNADKNSVSSKSSGGHRSPPEAYPARNDPRGLSGHKQAFVGREITKNPESSSWLDLEKFRFRDGLSENKNNFIGDSGRKDVTCRAQVFKDEYDEGAESDSSSDLFELKNYDLGDYSSGLPVYETTQPESVKRRGVPISASGP